MFEMRSEFYNICSHILGKEYKIKRINGGINNPTYLVSNHKLKLVLKYIKKYDDSKFDRFKAEKQFYKLMENIGNKNTPKLVEYFDNERILILEHIESDLNSQFPLINDKAINDCINFIHDINKNKNVAKILIQQKAADYYNSITGHIDNINLRLLTFEFNHLPEEYQNNAKELLKKIKNKWGIIRIETLEFIKNNPNQNFISENLLIISPSDFGFHNILTNHNNSYFIDFEFSGWDDPAKLYCDFILQPKFKIPNYYHQHLKQNFINMEYLDKYERRINILYELLKFKWIIIKFNFLNSNKFENNQFYYSNLMNLNYLDLNEIH